jgi:hypothetical protein
MGLSFSDLYWSAGFLEGEGSFKLHSSLMISASQVQLWPLQRLQKIFGGAISTSGRKRFYGESPCHAWYLYGHRAAGLMMTLYSLLSPRRQEQVAVALAKWKPQRIANKVRRLCPRGHDYSFKPNGHRWCKICHRESAIERGARARSQEVR